MHGEAGAGGGPASPVSLHSPISLLLTLSPFACATLWLRSMYQSTLLHAATRHGHVQLAAALLQRGADANALDYGGMRRTPLHWACRGGHVALVELLVAAGADTKVGIAQSPGAVLLGLVAGSFAQIACAGASPRMPCCAAADGNRSPGFPVTTTQP